MMAVGLPFTPYSGSVQTASWCPFDTASRAGIVRYQVSVMELNDNAPLMTCRNGTKLRTKLLIFQHWQDKVLAGGCLLVTGSPALRWQELYTTCTDPLGGVYTKPRNSAGQAVRGYLLNVRCAVTRSKLLLPRTENGIRLSLLPNHATRHRDVVRNIGCINSSDEVAVMGMEPRGTVIQC